MSCISGISYGTVYLEPGDCCRRGVRSSSDLYGFCCIFRVCHFLRGAGGTWNGKTITDDLPVPLSFADGSCSIFVKPVAGCSRCMAGISGIRIIDGNPGRNSLSENGEV